MTDQTGKRLGFSSQWRGAPLIVKAEGVELITDDGQRLLDAAGGAAVNNIGYGRREIVDAVGAAMREVGYVVPVWKTANRLALADRLVDKWLPEGFDRVSFAGGGSEANEFAIGLARLYHLSQGEAPRRKVIGRLPSYHGATLATLGAGGHMGRRANYEPMLPDWPKVPWDDAEALATAIEAAGPQTVAAFIAEPVIGAAGPGLIPPPEYWSRVSEICRDYGVLMIADEVMTGFGRTGRRWGYEHDDGWTPDILVSGKGMGGGYVPISLLSASSHVLNPVDEAGLDLMYYTYAAQDAMCAGALAVLDVMEREGLTAQAESMGCALSEGLRSTLGDHPHVAEVRGRGLLIGVELIGVSALAVLGEALQRGVWIYPGAASPGHGEALLYAPPLTITMEHVDRIVDVSRQSIDAAAKAL